MKFSLIITLATAFCIECIILMSMSAVPYARHTSLNRDLRPTMCFVRNIISTELHGTKRQNRDTYSYTEIDYDVQYFLAESGRTINGHIYEHKYSSNRYQVMDLFYFRENIIFIKKNVFRLMKHINAIIMLKVYIYLNGNVLILKNI